MGFPNFGEYDLETIELLAIRVREDHARLVFHCRYAGWKWRSGLERIKRILALQKDLSTCLNVEVHIAFTGVESIRCGDESLEDRVEVEKIFQEGFPVLGKVYRTESNNGLYQILFEFDCGNVNVIYRDCSQSDGGNSNL